jgi:hypothetical protein
MAHKFHIGESVTMGSATSRNVPGGFYEVIRPLPDDGSGEHMYRIKSAMSGRSHLHSLTPRVSCQAPETAVSFLRLQWPDRLPRLLPECRRTSRGRRASFHAQTAPQ